MGKINFATANPEEGKRFSALAAEYRNASKSLKTPSQVAHFVQAADQLSKFCRETRSDSTLRDVTVETNSILKTVKPSVMKAYVRENPVSRGKNARGVEIGDAEISEESYVQHGSKVSQGNVTHSQGRAANSNPPSFNTNIMPERLRKENNLPANTVVAIYTTNNPQLKAWLDKKGLTGTIEYGRPTSPFADETPKKSRDENRPGLFKRILGSVTGVDYEAQAAAEREAREGRKDRSERKRPASATKSNKRRDNLPPANVIPELPMSIDQEPPIDAPDVPEIQDTPPKKGKKTSSVQEIDNEIQIARQELNDLGVRLPDESANSIEQAARELMSQQKSNKAEIG